MEGISKNAITNVSRDKNMAPDQNGLPVQKKTKSGVNLLKAALYLLRKKSSKKSKSKSIQVDMGSKFSWKGIVGSMRPMHLQGNQTPTPAVEGKPATLPADPEQIPVGGYIEEAHVQSQMVDGSPSPFSISSYGSGSDMSSYGSVSDMSQYESPLHTLPELCAAKPGEETTPATFWYGGDDDDEDDDGGNDMIDAKAEEFIANFYEQIRLQNLNC